MNTRMARIEGDVAYVPLTQGHEAVVDAADAAWASQWNWRARPEGHTIYAVRTAIADGRRRHVYMHRALMAPERGMVIDHVDGSGLNNRRSNLRECSTAQNLQNVGLRSTNTSGFKGLRWDKARSRWRVEIMAGRARRTVGRFERLEDAVAARDAAYALFHGEFARTDWSVQRAA